jgi:hypothetical protein
MGMVAQPLISVYGDGRIEISAIYGNGNEQQSRFTEVVAVPSPGSGYAFRPIEP